MENIAKPALIETITTHRPASLEKIPQSRSGRFGQILSNVVTKMADKPTEAKPATLGNGAPPRSTFFMNNMSLEQRRSAIEDTGFSAQTAAMERIAAPRNRLLE
ncbi:hypothetical protein [Pseudomonas syringae]|uniref:hypothetical protein n=1 Tax=Pseudomonas syringae TaxID=317 RepID=UPI000407C812|nr:hypothetical protein [Pseudomonas syringae]